MDNHILPLSRIRNFDIIAHIDHGKSTFADRLIEHCQGSRARLNRRLDSLDIEQERGITVKAQTARLMFKASDGLIYQLNLIDTPGHVDFSSEVTRSMVACEGSLVLVDATQGVQAQTLAHVTSALECSHAVMVLLNKVDLASAEVERVRNEIESLLGIPGNESWCISAKTGEGIHEALEILIKKLPPPQGDRQKPVKALIFDSWYDAYLGVMLLVRIFEGSLTQRQQVRLGSESSDSYTIDNLGCFTPERCPLEALYAGEIGYITLGMKALDKGLVGKTLYDAKAPISDPILPMKNAAPAVFCSLFPTEEGDFELLRKALAKLHLNDTGFTFEAEKSTAFGYGFRCGFLGFLHLEVTQERLQREYDIELVATAPSVVYKVYLKNGLQVDIYNPVDLPDMSKVDRIEEPWCEVTLFVPETDLGGILSLCVRRRGREKAITYLGGRVRVVYELPLSSLIFDFYDRLKSLTRGYGSMDYHLLDYRESEIVKLEIRINQEAEPALACLVHRSQAEARGRQICLSLKEKVRRHLFKIAIQAVIGGKIVARETLSELKNDVTSKCYGGDISRKRKLLDRQKEGKKAMQRLGNITVPASVFLEVLRIQDDN